MRIIEVKKSDIKEDKKANIRVVKSNRNLLIKLIFILSLFNAAVSGLLLIGVWRIIVEWAQKIL